MPEQKVPADNAKPKESTTPKKEKKEKKEKPKAADDPKLPVDPDSGKAKKSGRKSARSRSSSARSRPVTSDTGHDGACKFNQFGCNFEGTEKKTHQNKEPVHHLSMLNDHVIDTKREMNIMSEELIDLLRSLDTTWVSVERLRQIGTSAFVWRITDWTGKFELARGGHEVVMFSPSFYTARHGYRMVVSLCPYGDGKVRGQYMSAFVAVVKGQYDGLLHWPFSYKVKLIMLDQEPDKMQRVNHAVVLNVGKPKKDNHFLRRPISDRNPSFGLQKFIDFPTFNSRKYHDGETDDVFLKIELTDDIIVGDLRYE